MKRLTFAGLFCDIAMCYGTPGTGLCEDGPCSQRKTWERLRAIEDILGDEYDLDRLRALTKADREERIFISPVKIGDTVYYITGLYGNLVKPATVEEVYFGDSTLALGVSTGFAKFPILEKHYFITKEAAEDALRRRCKED